MIIGIDIDDTLSYLYDRKIQAAQEYITKNKMPYKIVDAGANFLGEIFDWPQEECNKFWVAEADNLLAGSKVREHAAEVIKRFKQAGHEIVIITARSTEWHKDPYNLSLVWLKENDILFDKLFVGYRDKTQVCIDEKLDVFIDDLPDNLVKLQPLGIKTIMMLNPHNEKQDIYSGIVAKDWLEIEKIINSI